MARHNRVFLQDYPHHIVQRGHNRERVFTEESDYKTYLENLSEVKTTLGIKLYGFCLMTNHVHLLLEPTQESHALSSLMKTLSARHTRRINCRNRRSGTMWEGRFKCSVVDTDRYFLACLRYIDLNPVRGAIVEHPQGYRWSSYRTLVGRDANEWLDLHPILYELGKSSNGWQTAYEKFVADGVKDSELEIIRTAVQRNQLTGHDEFRNRISKRIGRRIGNNAPGRPMK